MAFSSLRGRFARGALAAIWAAPLLLAISSRGATIATVPVGNVGNAGDTLLAIDGTSGYGAVDYHYRIGTTEVTNAEYAEFLNAKGASDPLGLYNLHMDYNRRGGITRSGVEGSYTYATKVDMGNKPVIFVSWYDAVRFVNWLHNGQGTGDTESGAYTLLGGTPVPANGPNITRNAGARWVLPSEDEWYKAAYHQPATQGGDSDDYWLYPTASNTLPTPATASLVGDISNPGAGVANHDFGVYWNDQEGNVTTVGSAGALSASFYGTSDQGGNVWEWNETSMGAIERSVRGGSFVGPHLQATHRLGTNPSYELIDLGFRVARVPEPSTAALALAGGVVLLVWRAGLSRRATR